MFRVIYLAAAFARVGSFADIIVENNPIVLSDVFDLEYAIPGNESIYSNRHVKYYCVFRSNWNHENHPEEFPRAARWSAPLLYSHTKHYIPTLKGTRASHGVESLVETKFAETFVSDLFTAGNAVLDYLAPKAGEAGGFFINQVSLDQNYVFLDPIKVSADHPFLSAIAAMVPSPDWFTQFYLFETFNEETLTYWERFAIRSYPWDAGTATSVDGGYNPLYRDTDPAEDIVRIEKSNAPNNKIFLGPNNDTVPHVAEWECVLHACPPEDPDCEKPDWPPSSAIPTTLPSSGSSGAPGASPSTSPSSLPSSEPSSSPVSAPSSEPSSVPTTGPSDLLTEEGPTATGTNETVTPSAGPTFSSTEEPTAGEIVTKSPASQSTAPGSTYAVNRTFAPTPFPGPTATGTNETVSPSAVPTFSSTSEITANENIPTTPTNESAVPAAAPDSTNGTFASAPFPTSAATASAPSSSATGFGTASFAALLMLLLAELARNS